MTRTTCGALLLGAALTLTACTGGNGTTTTATVPATSTTPASGQSASSAATTPSTIDSDELSYRMLDAMVKAGSGKGTLSSPAGVTGTMAFRFPSATTSESVVNMGVQGLSVEAVSKDGAVYVKGLPTALSGGKPWVKGDPNGSDELSKAIRESGANMADPRAMVDQWKGGTATLVEQTATSSRYTVTGTTTQQGANATIDLTLDADDRPQEVSVKSSGVTVMVKYSDWGAPVTIEVPPADQVGTLTVHTS